MADKEKALFEGDLVGIKGDGEIEIYAEGACLNSKTGEVLIRDSDGNIHYVPPRAEGNDT